MNAVSIISIGRDGHLQYCLPSVEKYCEKINCNLEIITSPKWGFPETPHYNFKTFEKNQVYYLFEKYDSVLRVDSDVIITPDCPDVFKLDSQHIHAVREDVGSRRQDRLRQINTSQKSLGKLEGWDNFYINSGVVLASKQHREIFNIENDLQAIANQDLGPFKEQTLLNWKINKLNFKIKDLGHKYNHMSMFGSSIENSYIIHFAGPQHNKKERMKDTFKKFYQS